MKTKRLVLSTLLSVFLLMGAALSVQAQDTTKTASEQEGQEDLVQVLQGSDQFSTLVSALEKAGLTKTLKSDGPFTVLAPTNDAFSALDTSVDSMSTEKLQSVLRNHLLQGTVSSSQATQIGQAQTVLGDTLSIKDSDGSVMIGEATVVDPDLEATNGVVHAIDAVLVPAESSGNGTEDGDM